MIQVPQLAENAPVKLTGAQVIEILPMFSICAIIALKDEFTTQEAMNFFSKADELKMTWKVAQEDNELYIWL
jgi:hypothetical protein